MREYILTDISSNINTDFNLDESSAIMPFKSWSVEKYEKKAGVEKGVEVLRVTIGDFEIVFSPTKAMGIIEGSYNNKKIGWQSPSGKYTHPFYAPRSERGGTGWLYSFGEFMLRCGLESLGPPYKDEDAKSVYTLHGRLSHLPVSFLKVSLDNEAESIKVYYTIYESVIFGPSFRLDGIYEIKPTGEVKIEDTITNLSAQPVEGEILYHINFGEDLLGKLSKLKIDYESVQKRRGGEVEEDFLSITVPSADSEEKVYLIDTKDKNGEVSISLENEETDFACDIVYQKETLPCFTLWKYLGDKRDGYVIGLEPGSSFPKRKSTERKEGRLIILEAEAEYKTEIMLRFRNL